MAFIQTTVLGLTIFAFFIGQIARLNLFNLQFPLIDIAIVFLSLINFINHLTSKKLKNNNKFFTYFLIFAWTTLGITTIKYNINSLRPTFYLVRLTSILSLIIFPPQINKKTKNFFYLALFANIIFGLIQYLFWPDFTYFDVYQWDPHLYRLVSTFFDPTFTGLIYLFFIITVFLNQNFPYRLPILTISYLAMILTYSRATYLCFLLAFAFISHKTKKPKIFLLLNTKYSVLSFFKTSHTGPYVGTATVILNLFLSMCFARSMVNFSIPLILQSFNVTSIFFLFFDVFIFAGI